MIKRFFALVIFALVGWSLAGTTAGAQLPKGAQRPKELTAKLLIKFAGTNTCAYVAPGDGRMRLKQAACDPSDTTLHFEISAPPGSNNKRRLRHIDTNRCLQLVYDDVFGGPPTVLGVACSSISPAFYFAGVAAGIHAIKQDRAPQSGPCCIKSYCLNVSGNSQNFVVGGDVCPLGTPNVSFRFKLVYF